MFLPAAQITVRFKSWAFLLAIGSNGVFFPFDSNSEAKEVIVLKGGRMLKATRENVKAKKWPKQFFADYTKKK